MGRSILHQEGRHMLIPPPYMERYLPITSPKFGLANHDPSSMSGHIALEVHYLMASMGSNVIPLAKCMCSF